MNILKELLLSKSSQNYEDTKDSNPRILFICPGINSQGYYRMILPYLELPKYGYHTKLIGLKKHDFNTTYTLDDLGLTPKAIKWADYIVFKQLTKDYSYFFEAILEINPNVKLIMDIWNVIHGLPKEHPEYSKMNVDAKHNLLNNLRYMDWVTSCSKSLINLYTYLVHKHDPESTTYFSHIPNLLPANGFDLISTSDEQEHTSIRIGVLTSPTNYLDVLMLKSVFTLFKEKYKDYVTFVIVGWDGELSNGDAPLHDLAIEYHKGESFLQYHQRLKDLSLDMALLPVTPIEYNKHRSKSTYLECAILKIAVIASGDSIYDHVILNNDAGILASSSTQWESAITLLIENVKLRKQLAQNAFDLALKSHSFSSNSIAYYKTLYK